MTIDRSRLGLSERDFVIIFSGRISPEKGIHELISAMAALSAYPAIKLLIIGSPFYGNAKNEDSYVRALKQEAKQIEDRIVFTGFIRYEQMPGYYHMADIAVVPSMWDDPCPFTVLEAQAAGLPIVTTKRGGIPEEVTEGNALLLSTDETFTDRLAEAILHLYSHPEQRARMSAKALANATKYTKQRLAEDFFQVINE
jgi:glycosyltransferase involved in cell wall biosynthesis